MIRDNIVRLLFRLGYLLSFLIFPLFVMDLANQRLANIPLRLLFFCFLVLAGAWLFSRAWPGQGWGSALVLTSLGYGTAYKLASFIPDISPYPFSLSWSEGSRYYYASLWFSKQVYGIKLPPSVLHPSRYLLQSLPFLIPHSTLLMHRIWQVLLWIVSATLTSWLLTRRLTSPDNKRTLAITVSMFLWGFLFLFQGPIYYHLLAMVILLLWGFDRRHFWRSLFLVAIASLWAGISRVNWLPVPGFLAAALYWLEAPIRGKSMWRYLLPSAVWVVVGTGLAFASQMAYQLWSGNPPAWFGSSFTSNLLWYRLLPNQTFPLGILPSSILVSLPLLGLILIRLYKIWRDYHPIRMLGLAAILFVLFAGGVVVSVKIGGGSNLHNLDAYLALLLVIGSYIYLGNFTPDHPLDSRDNDQEKTHASSGGMARLTEGILLAATFAVPLYFTLSTGGALPRWNYATAQFALQSIDSATQDATSKGGEVLFINQRQLLTFNDIKQVPLVPDDELVFLMEMAMSDNSSYLDAFYNDISRQRFALIVSEPLTTQHQGRSHGFGEENDAWVVRISEPILCYYAPAATLDAVGIVLYTPLANPCK